MQPYPLKMQARLVLCAAVIVIFTQPFEAARTLYGCKESREHNDTGELKLQDAAPDDDVHVAQDDLRVIAYRDEIATAMWEDFEAPL
jgi:hypothetical protein